MNVRLLWASSKQDEVVPFVQIVFFLSNFNSYNLERVKNKRLTWSAENKCQIINLNNLLWF